MMNDKITSHQVEAVLHRGVTAQDERIENQTEGVLRQARSVVPNLHLDLGGRRHPFRAGPGGQGDLAARRQTHDFVLEQQFKEADEFVFIHR